jgi:hypothetical protein
MAKNMPPEAVAAAELWLVSREMDLSGEIFSAGGGKMSRLTFLESHGFYAPSPSPETFRDAAAQICDMSRADLVTKQGDHQANTARVLPGYPL